MTYYNKNDSYFSKNLSKLIAQHGGKWVIISGGRLVGVGPKKSLKRFFELAKRKNPDEIPLVAPIPTKEQVKAVKLCGLVSSRGATIKDFREARSYFQKGLKKKWKGLNEQVVHDDLDSLIGTWQEDKDFNEALKLHDQIDPSL